MNIAPSNYSPTNAAAIDCLNISDGAIYSASDPLLGTTDGAGFYGSGNPALRLADNLIAANKFDRLILVPLAVGGTNVAIWAAGFCANRIPAAINRLSARGIVAGTNVTIVIIWGQGESDTNDGTSQSTYTSSLLSVIAASRVAGFTGPWFIAKQTQSAGVTSAAVQAAQIGIVDHASGIWAGPDADALTGTACSGSACRIADNTHWSDAGSASYAAAWLTALSAFGVPF